MRLVTWNCCRGAYSAKASLLDILRPDIAVIQECGKPPSIDDHCLWFGDNPKQGITVVAKDAYHMHALPPLPDVPNYCMPIQVSGAKRFIILAVWAKGRQQYSYVEGVVKAVEMYADLLTHSPAVVIGDFNSNTSWDDEHPSDLCHTALVERLAGLGMVSSYHAFHGMAHGQERCPTHYFQWNEKKPYHIDYAFIPERWLPSVREVTIGSYQEWKDYSDHRPLMVDFWD